jgi:flagellar biogenesis protein FliO
MFPRKLPAEGATVVLPEPTLPPELAAKLEPPPKPIAKPDPKPAVKPEATIDAKIDNRIAEPKQPDAPKKPAAIATAPEEDAWSKLSMYAALGLAALGGGAWILKKRRTPAAPTSTIEVIAQRSLAGKAKVVWLAAGTREMVVAVTAQNVRVLGQWKRGEAGPAQSPQLPLPEAQAMPVMPRTVTSPAVNGILKLRAQTQQNINADVATDDVEADAQWTREILAATGGRR